MTVIVPTQGGPFAHTRPRHARPIGGPRFKAVELDALIAGYKAGRTMQVLAAGFGIDRRTVSTYLRRAEVPVRHGGLDHEEAIEAGRRYETGWSSGQLAK